MRTSAGEKTIFAMHTRASNQERRAPARRGFRFALATATGFCGPITFRPARSFPVPRLAYASRSSVRVRTSAGERRIFRCTNAQPTKSGGCQPAVGCIAPRGQCTASNVRRVTTIQSRAAGVSPPWISNSGAIVNVYHGRLTPPALVLQCERPPAKKRYLRCTDAHPTRSGGCQPAVGSIAPRGQCTASNVRRVTTIQSRSSGCQPAVV
jgi:hypothetical protein